MPAKTYDPSDVSVIVDNVYITGLGEDMVEVVKDEDGYEPKVGAQGDVIIAKNNNKLGTITITVQSSSPAIAHLDRLANSGRLVPVSVIYSGDPKETSSATEAYVKKPADRTYGKSAEDREYELQCLDLKME
ncbi:phage structural protein [Paenibacillus silviterrae]|uniref:phage structural protein n=1 Tax=Paenibacillus silviterrae TaxID=3242194 RepID=UPI0025439600|nr:phage protein [Paenibacillus chinjuensis]